MSRTDSPRRYRIAVHDEETGEEVAAATGVETMVLVVAPDLVGIESFRQITVGDPEDSLNLLVEVVKDVSEQLQDLALEPGDGIDDNMLLEMTDGLPPS